MADRLRKLQSNNGRMQIGNAAEIMLFTQRNQLLNAAMQYMER